MAGTPGCLTGWRIDELAATYAANKKIEGHLPGASEKTLVRMRLLGVDGDHEAMTVEEVEARLLHGYGVTLRHSSIRPDLPNILKQQFPARPNSWLLDRETVLQNLSQATP